MAERKDDVETLKLAPVGKRPKRAQTMVECFFVDCYGDCRAHVDFLQGALHSPQLNTDVVLQYAIIYSLIRTGENLTFLRDDEKFYKREWEDRQSDTGEGGKTPPSQGLSVIMSFIFFRNQLLHHNPYKSEGEKTTQLRQVFDEAINGRIIGVRRRDTGLPKLISLLQEAHKSAEILCHGIMPITSLKLSKPVGPAPTFDGSIKGCISALQIEAGVLRSIPGGTDPVLISATRSAYLRCFQILNDLQKTREVTADPTIISNISLLINSTNLARVHLAHALSYTAAERQQTEVLLKGVCGDDLLRAAESMRAKLEKLEKAKTILASLQVEPKHELPETEQYSKMPIVVIPRKKLVLPLSEHSAQVSVRSYTSVDSSQLSKPLTPLKVTVEAQKRALIVDAEPKEQPLVDYSSSSSDDDAVDKTEKKEDTKNSEGTKSPKLPK